MNRIISAILLSVATLSVQADADLHPNAPSTYTVVPGDTLWGIAKKFTSSPWKWPELWRMNREQIRNPHLIYPGNVISLNFDANGAPYLSLDSATIKLSPKVYSEAIKAAVPAIPPRVIEPFLAQPNVLPTDQMEGAVRITATQENRVHLGNGDRFYVVGADTSKTKWMMFRPAKPLKDPETKEILGYEAFHLGKAVLRHPGRKPDDPQTFEVVAATQEVGRNDYIRPAPETQVVDYLPHSPDKEIKGRVLSIYNGMAEAGTQFIVTINRGKADGVEHGHVFTLLHAEQNIKARDPEGRPEVVKIPEEAYAHMFVFRVFDRMSYALIVDATGPVKVGDAFETPRKQ